MANYAYINTDGLDEAEAESLIRTAVESLFGDKLTVEKADFAYDGPTWCVTAPGTALSESEARKSMMPPNEDFGFVVSLLSPRIKGHEGRSGFAFRRPFNHWASWAQGCITEELADILGKDHTYDATDEVNPPGTRGYRVKPTFREWIYRNLDPLDPDDVRWAEGRFKESCPKGFWGEGNG
jgi:hypothetical protein